MATERTGSGRELAEQWGLPVEHALYRETGDWYHQLERFPGALLDAELLAEVYIDLIGARQSQLILASETRAAHAGGFGETPRRQREVPLAARVTEDDRTAHRAFIATLGDKPIWNDFLPPGP